MNSSADIRSQVIDQLLAINDRDFLFALQQIITKARMEAPSVPLTEDQKLMLAMSEHDIESGRVIEQGILHEQELKWLEKK